SHLPVCDVVASTCLLSQLSFGAGQALGADHPALPAVRSALLTTQLRTLATLTRNRGSGFLVNDVAVAPRGQLEAQLVGAGPRALLGLVEGTENQFRGMSDALVEAV